ncbi:hypothetical protein ABMA79_07480 [Halobacteriovorax sp. HFRX-2_2]|uniref:hypothetical protein n=1 Tax=unclassified Halobacteriovorax TaxID=2639665 RepID=UPI0037129231
MEITLRKRLLTVVALLSFSFFSVSCGEGNVDIPGVDGPNVNLLEDNVVVSMVLEDVSIMAGATYKVPKYKKSFIGLNPNLEGAGSVLTFTVSLDDIFSSDVNRLDPKTLPGGRMIPGVAAGALPAVAFTVEKVKNMAFYVGPKVFGIWVPLQNFNLYGFAWTKSFKAGDKRVGNISLFGQDENGENAGFFLALSVKSAYEKRLKKLSRKY